MAKVTLEFNAGTLILRGLEGEFPLCKKDRRIGALRAMGLHYREIANALQKRGIIFKDEAQNFEIVEPPTLSHTARDYQSAAVASWVKNDHRGMCILPTGSGKTLTALLAMRAKSVSTLIVTPTLDLVAQWHEILSKAFTEPVGIMGGGTHDVQPVTVTTYDSAHIFMPHLGSRFQMLVFDEAHHLPSATYRKAAQMSMAPYRLGLTATPERQDGSDVLFNKLVGETVYRQDIDEMAGHVLADYDTQTIPVDLSDDERRAHDEARSIYLAFLRTNRISMGGPRGFQTFLQRSAQSDDGRKALAAYRLQKELARGASAKKDIVSALLKRHKNTQTIVFTDDNKTAYALSKLLLIPVITHQSKVKERKMILAGLRSGRFHAVVTSRVLNEGVDVPSVSVAIVVSGSGSVREHVQRLGRILRKDGDARATLYELVSAGTSEAGTSKRRRNHRAYR